MLHEVTGDILLTRARAIAHGVSPNDDFHQGLALALRERWPALYQAFRHHCKTYHPEPGGLWSWDSPDGGVRVISLFTQDPPRAAGQHPGRASTKHVGHALKALHRYAEAEELASLALPKLATGVGGLEWTAVRPLLEQHLGTLKIPVVVYITYRKDTAAKEPF